MKKLLILLILLQFSAQAQKLSPKAKQLMYYYQQIQQTPHAPVLHFKFIQTFPTTKFDFVDLFDAHTEDELAVKGTEYVKTFRKLGKLYPDSVLPRAIMIGKDMPTWSAGPADELQKTIYYLTNDHPQMFLDIVWELKKDERKALAQFLYSSPSGKNENYDILLELFDKVGDKKTKKIFEEVTTTEIE